ncbi:bifunctional acetate--CoA ligase family protein/GNAT family N-acetyltransferase [Nonomuraea rhodomycinica]|uniref:GNAT family N-acetyltransferase n=1 Tax=Nonomuraea rhodomycinica TaxID=1712872 RepID=A0A7Y6MEZ9_9ACTN|nr:GNAT family N-acetyltransferase [Nonomuraea rhodomycinica]NUW44221.1 GNAT family N-acetyltransferase [Nonomuraea rhodomycinica]
MSDALIGSARKAGPDAGYDVLLRQGGIAHVRPLCPGDRRALHELVDRSSEHSAYLRFFTGGRNTAHSYMDRVTGPGYEGRALVATVRGRLVGVAEYIPYGDGRADLAILLDDAVHGHGLGTLLLEHVALDAAAHGVRELVADVLAENRAMISVLSALGLDTTRHADSGTLRIALSCRPTALLRAGVEARDHVAERASLAHVLAPRSVAVIGASRDPAGVGHRVLRNLIDGCYAGPLYPVNPKADRIAGLTCYPDLRAVPGPVDLAVVAVPPERVLDVARDCAEAGVAGLVVVTSGFAEAGRAGAEAELLRVCRTAGMRLIGPNCLGVVNTGARLNASFLPIAPARGRVALMSQSGAVGAALLERLDVSSFVSVGNKADVSGNDLLEYWEDDPDTDVVVLYLESFGNPRRFARIARRVAGAKPVLLVKSGRTGAGDRAVRSHTAAKATPDVAVDALVRAAGVIRLDSVHELIDTARLLSSQPLPRGRRVAIVGNSGGPQAMAADACERHGLVVPELPAGLVRARGAAAVGNPVDLTAEALAAEIGAAVEAVAGSPDVDAVIVVYTPPFGSGPEETRRAIVAAAERVAGGPGGAGKPVLACVVGHDGLIEGRVPGYAYPEQAVEALAHAVRYAEWRARPAELPEEPPPAETERACALVLAELADSPGGRWLAPSTVLRLLGCYGLDLVRSAEADGPDAAAAAAVSLGLPVVLKAAGPVHKSDVGGVRLGLRTPEEVREAYEEMAARIGPAMTGATVQPMLPPGVEIIVGGVNYPVFGPLVMVGMGGVTAELVADQAFRVPPVTTAAATEMIGELRCAPLLHGYRGARPADVAALARQVVRVGRLLEELPEVAELDLNPVIVSPDGAVTVDARIRVAPGDPQPSPLLRRLR